MSTFEALEQYRLSHKREVVKRPEPPKPPVPITPKVEPQESVMFDDNNDLVYGEANSTLDILGDLKDLQLDDSQLDAVHGLARETMGNLIGAAGSGKTTTVKFLVHTLLNGSAEANIEPLRIGTIDMKSYSDTEATTTEGAIDTESGIVPSIAMVAFTGQATQVMKLNIPAAWHRNIMTIHSILGYAPAEYTREDGSIGMRFEPTYGANRKFRWDVIIIDEASMVSVHLWHELRAAAKDTCRFYFIGDINQLSPTAGQSVFGFALHELPTFELTHIHRQKDEAANKIVDAAHRILAGKQPEFDDASKDKNWRVIGFELAPTATEAHKQIVNIAHQLASTRVAKEVDPSEPLIYDPFRDRIITQTNGYNIENTASMVGQAQLNESLSQIFGQKTKEPRVVIDYDRGQKTFAVGYRVMATKNESPNTYDRVTNGMTGKIISIKANGAWRGDKQSVGLEEDVAAYKRKQVNDALAGKADVGLGVSLDLSTDISNIKAVETSDGEDRLSGPSSHTVTVKYDTGAIRDYSFNSGIDQLQLAYASTTHKSQGMEAPTIIVVLHHASKFMMNRENFYTACTRASQRLIILYTPMGMNVSLARQQIYGKTLKEKVEKYRRLAEATVGDMKVNRVQLRPKGATHG